MRFKKLFIYGLGITSILLSSCATMFPQQGPSTYTIKAQRYVNPYITVVDLTPGLVYLFKKTEDDALKKLKSFLNEKYSPSLGEGDIVEITIYESPPPVLLASVSTLTSAGGLAILQIPPQIVDDRGYINVPFVGRIYVLGKRPEDVSKEIEEKLSQVANNPHVIVRVIEYKSAYVTVFGHVKESRRVPLGYNTSTILDVLASVGGVTSPIRKTLIQIDRHGKKIIIPLEDIIQNPDLNIYLQPGDVITVIYKTKSAILMGATAKNTELEFEATGISLAQALSRAGGLNFNTAHAKGVFVFRYEDEKVLKKLGIKFRYVTKEGKVPTIYNIDLSKPESVFVTKDFKIKDGDIIYVATAPSVQIQQFLQLITHTISPIFMIDRMSR